MSRVPALPVVSVVVPTYRRPQRLARCIDAIAAQDYPHDRLELVVVEDGGPTEELAHLRGRDHGPLTVRFEGQPHSGPAAARNLGADLARGELLAFTDDDCCPHPDWVAELVRALDGAPRRIAGGHTINALGSNPFSRASQDLVTYITAYGMRRGDPFFASNNFLLPRELFLDSGGFDRTFPLAGGEDREFSDRLAQAGVEFVHVPTARIDHYHHLGLRSFLRQHFRYGRGAYQFHRARSTRAAAGGRGAFSSMLGQMEFGFYVDLVRFPTTTGGRGSYLASSLLLLSQASNALGFFFERLARVQGESG